MKKLTLMAVAASLGLCAAAQINSPLTPGYYTRGNAMFDIENYAGTVDQLGSIARSRQLTASEHRQLDYALAMSALAEGHYRKAYRMLQEWLAKYGAAPERTDVLMSTGDCMFTQGRYADALNIYDDVRPEGLADARRAADLEYRLGYTCLKLGMLDRADSEFGLLAYDPVYRDAATFYRAYIQYVKGNYGEAKRGFEQCDTNTMPGEMADYYLAQIAYKNEDYQKSTSLARALLQRSRVPAEYRAEASRVLGESLFMTGNVEGAVAPLREYVAMTDTPAISSLYVLGIAEYRSGDYAAAVKSLRPVTADDSAMGQNAYLYIGQALLHLGDTDGAILAFDRALRMTHDNDAKEAAYYNYAVAKYSGASVPFGSSVATFEDFLRQYPDSKYADDVRSYIITGYVTDNNYEAALAAINRVPRPNDAVLAAKQQVLYTLGARCLAAGNADAAIPLLSEAYGLRGRNSEIGAETALTLGEAYLRTGENSKAVDLLKTYLGGRSTSNFPIARYDLGYAYMGLRDYDAARPYFEMVAKNPGNLGSDIAADALTRLGDCHYYRRQWQQAADAYSRAYSMNPSAGDYALFQQAVMQGYAGNFGAKLSGLQNLQSQFPTSALIPDALLEMTEAQLRTGDTDAAIGTWQRLIDEYPATSQGRSAYLQLASTQANGNDEAAAIETYKTLIKRYPTSDEGRQGAEMLKRIMASRGELDGYLAFIDGVENAPRLDATEADNLAFEYAQKSFLDNGDVTLLRRYYDRYGLEGAGSMQTVAYLMEDASDAGRQDEAYCYASQLISRWPDNSAAEQAYAIAGEYEFVRGNGEEALKNWKELERRASTPAMTNKARMGIMRVARDLGRPDDLAEAAAAVLSSSTLGAGDKTEARFSQGLACQLKGDSKAAMQAWKELAPLTDRLYGAKAAVYLAQAQLDAGDNAAASATAETFVNSGTPHAYWLARGFIVLADAYRAQGKTNEANDYLKALRENYPGTEADIFSMIDERLSK